jgi:hypothetical protein
MGRFLKNKGKSGIPMWLLLGGGGLLAYMLISKGSQAATAAIRPIIPAAAATQPTVEIGGVTIPQSTAVAAASSVLSAIQNAVA